MDVLWWYKCLQFATDRIACHSATNRIMSVIAWIFRVQLCFVHGFSALFEMFQLGNKEVDFSFGFIVEPLFLSAS